MTRAVLFLTDALVAGGGTRALVNFARHVDRSRFEPALAGVGGDLELLKRLRAEDFPVTILPGAAALGEYLARAGVDAVVLNRSGRRTEHTDAILRRIDDLGPGVALLERNIFGEPDTGPLAARVDIRFHQSPAMVVRYLRKLGSRPDERLLSRHAIVENPVDVERVRASALSPEERRARRASWGVSDEDVLVGHVCRPDTEKWDDAHIVMLRRLCGRNPALWYLVREPPPSRAARIRWASRGRCVLLDFTRDERETYETISNLDVYVHASRVGECFGNAIAEAMALGLPVVTRSTPHRKLTNGQVYQVDHGLTGFVADTADTYAAAVETLARDAELRRRMGAAGRARLESDFSPSSLTRRLERLILLALKLRGNALSTDEEALLAGGPTVLGPERYGELVRELRRRELDVFGPPTLRQRLREKARAPGRLWRRWRDKRRRPAGGGQ